MTLDDLTPLTLEVARVTYEAMSAPDGVALWRGPIQGGEWKIAVNYDADAETFHIRVIRRDLGAINGAAN